MQQEEEELRPNPKAPSHSQGEGDRQGGVTSKLLQVVGNAKGVAPSSVLVAEEPGFEFWCS